MSSWFWKYTIIFLLTANILVFAAVFSFSDDKLHIVFCDVGQGDAILIYQKTTQVLIDGGPDTSVLSCLSSHMPFWDRKIEAVIISHTELDHIAGLVEVIKRYKIDHIITSGITKETEVTKALNKTIENQKVPVLFLSQGGEIHAGRIDLKALWPSKKYLAQNTTNTQNQVLGASTQDSVNTFSLVLLLSYGFFKGLLTGDIVPPASDILSDYLEPITVLKVPHHGSKNGLTEKMLNTTSPKLAVISVGKNNRYGHPHKETINLLQSRSIPILRTDRNGKIEITTNGSTWQLHHN